MLFIEKDNSLCVPVLEGLLKYWPYANRVKEHLFLKELSAVIGVCDADKIEHLVPKILKRVIRCANSDDGQVADRSICIIQEPHLLTIMKMYKEQTYPIVVPVIADLNKKHWLPRVERRFKELRSIVKESDGAAYFEAM